MILYDGPSLLDGSPILAIATGIHNDSANDKTGAMVQVFIMPKWVAPIAAVLSGDDGSVCGNCPQRPSKGGACYVDVGKSVMAVWNAYHRGSYDDEVCLSVLEGRRIRFGAWGDPAAVPFEAWAPVLDVCDIDGSTGYTHQVAHKGFDTRIAMFCQVSVETPKQALKYQAKGYRTFRVAGDANKLLPGEVECLADAKGMTCFDCGLCDGQTADVAITIHGAKAGRVKTHDVIAVAS